MAMFVFLILDLNVVKDEIISNFFQKFRYGPNRMFTISNSVEIRDHYS